MGSSDDEKRNPEDSEPRSPSPDEARGEGPASEASAARVSEEDGSASDGKSEPDTDASRGAMEGTEPDTDASGDGESKPDADASRGAMDGTEPDTDASGDGGQPDNDAPGAPMDGGHEPPAALAVPTRKRRQMGIYDVLLVLVLLVTWLGPITWVGATKKETPYLDDFPWLRHQHRISCLFTNEVKGWQTYEMQVQRGGSAEWETMSEENYFELPVFGYRTRLHRVLGHSYKRGKGAQRLREVGQYIKQRYDRLNPSGPPLDAVRFVRIYMNNEMLAKQTGRFKPMKPEEVPKTYALYFGELRFDGKRPVHGGWGLTAAATEERNKAKPQPAKAPTQP